jgi:hypothetical protein
MNSLAIENFSLPGTSSFPLKEIYTPLNGRADEGAHNSIARLSDRLLTYRRELQMRCGSICCSCAKSSASGSQFWCSRMTSRARCGVHAWWVHDLMQLVLVGSGGCRSPSASSCKSRCELCRIVSIRAVLWFA